MEIPCLGFLYNFSTVFSKSWYSGSVFKNLENLLVDMENFHSKKAAANNNTSPSNNNIKDLIRNNTNKDNISNRDHSPTEIDVGKKTGKPAPRSVHIQVYVGLCYIKKELALNLHEMPIYPSVIYIHIHYLVMYCTCHFTPKNPPQAKSFDTWKYFHGRITYYSMSFVPEINITRKII